jgi:thiol:disulfide interchange protein DsbD
MLKADWTNSDETITKELAKFGRNSVPLYVLYSGKQNEEPQILPEIITPGIVLDALKKIEEK